VVLGARWRFWGGFFWGIGDEMLCAGYDVTPAQGLEGVRSVTGPPLPQTRMSCLHPISSSVSPGRWGRGAAGLVGWER